MLNCKVSSRLLLYMLAAALLSALIVFAPVAAAQTVSDSTVSDSVVSDAVVEDDGVISDYSELAAVINDPLSSVIELNPKTIYHIEEPIVLSHSLTIIGNGATFDFDDGAFLSIPERTAISVSSLTFSNHSGYSMTVSGSVSFGANVVFSGDQGIRLEEGGQLESGRNPVTAAAGLSCLVYADSGDGIVSLKDIRLTQVSGQANIIECKSTSGKIMFSGTVDIIASNGMAVYCPAGSDSPELSILDGAVVSIAAANAVHNRELDIPGAAIYAPGCRFTIGKNVSLGLTGSYCGIAVKTISVDDSSTLNMLCSKKPEQASFKCASLCADEKIVLGNGVSVTIGSSGGNYGSGLYGGTGIEAGKDCSFVFKSSSNDSCAIASDGVVKLAGGCSIVSHGCGYGIRARGINASERCTVNVDDAAKDGIFSESTVSFGTDSTVKISAKRSALYSTEDVTFLEGGIVELYSAGDGPALWINGTATDDLIIHGCKTTMKSNTKENVSRNSAVYISGSVDISAGTDATVINDSDFGIVAAGGSVNIKESGSVLRVSGGVGVLVSTGSLLLSDNAILLAEGVLDSAIRIERGSFSATGGTVIDAQGVRFGIETMSGDVYIDGAKSFDIRSTTDRAVFVENGRLTIINVERLSAWDRDPDNINWYKWWKVNPEYEHSWELTEEATKENWLYASHTALNPNLTSEHSQGVSSESQFTWYDEAWTPADYSRLGQFCSRPYGRANSFNIPAGKSFSWMLFGSSYDNILKFKLLNSTGDGTFDLSEDGTFTYSSLDYSRGVQSFDFVVENADGALSDPVSVSILVTASKPPVAHSATFPINAGETYIGQLSIVDYDGTISSIRIEKQPEHGSLIMNSDGRFSYQPEPGFNGIDGFTYVAIDNMGDESDTGYINLAVSMYSTMVACNSTIITESSVSAATRLTAIIGIDTVQPAPDFVILTQPTYGELAFDENEAELVTYIPYKDFSGTDYFSYAIVLEDGTYSEPAHVTIATVPSQRPTASGGTFYCTKNSSCSGRLSGYDIDGSIGLYSISEQPEKGYVELDAVTGKFVYHAEKGFTGSVFFTFTVSDNDGLSSESARIDIHVTSLFESLRSSGRMGAAVVLICIILAALAAVITLIIFKGAQRRRMEEDEKAKSRLFEFGSSDRNYFDDDYS